MCVCALAGLGAAQCLCLFSCRTWIAALHGGGGARCFLLGARETLMEEEVGGIQMRRRWMMEGEGVRWMERRSVGGGGQPQAEAAAAPSRCGSTSDELFCC